MMLWFPFQLVQAEQENSFLNEQPVTTLSPLTSSIEPLESKLFVKKVLDTVNPSVKQHWDRQFSNEMSKNRLRLMYVLFPLHIQLNW